MRPGDLNRIAGAFAEVSVGCALRSRALKLAETFRTCRGVPELFRLPTLGRPDGALLWATAYSVRSRRTLKSGPRRRQHSIQGTKKQDHEWIRGEIKCEPRPYRK